VLASLEHPPIGATDTPPSARQRRPDARIAYNNAYDIAAATLREPRPSQQAF
jgi:hypothetical protein